MGNLPVKIGALLMLTCLRAGAAQDVSDDYTALMQNGQRAIAAGSPQDALVAFQQALEKMQAANLTAGKIFPVQIAISTAYLQSGEISQAERTLLLATELERQAPNVLWKAELANNWACLHIKLGRYADAEAESEKLLVLIENEPSAAQVLPHILDGIAAAEIHLGRYADALRHQQEAVRRFQAFLPPDHSDLIKGYEVLGTAQFMCGQIADSRSSFEFAIHSAERLYGSQSRQLIPLIRDELVVLGRLGLKKEVKARQHELSRIPPATTTELSAYTLPANSVAPGSR